MAVTIPKARARPGTLAVCFTGAIAGAHCKATEQAPPPAPSVTATPNSEEVRVSADPGMARWIALAKEDLQNRHGTKEADIEVLDARRVTWPDGSLGCPKPGMVYTHAPVPGGLIRLRTATREYRYHCSERIAPFLCTRPLRLPPEGSAVETQ